MKDFYKKRDYRSVGALFAAELYNCILVNNRRIDDKTFCKKLDLLEKYFDLWLHNTKELNNFIFYKEIFNHLKGVGFVHKSVREILKLK